MQLIFVSTKVNLLGEALDRIWQFYLVYSSAVSLQDQFSWKYYKISNMRCTKSLNLNVSRFGLQLS